MSEENILLIAKNEQDWGLLPKMANRHGLIAGATGTGKTVTLRVIAEALSNIGVPVFMSDVKGDLASMAEPGGGHEGIQKRVDLLKLGDYPYQGYPIEFWDVFGGKGHPVRTTISEMGPLLLSRLLNLNDTQSGVMSLVFRIADDEGLLLLDLKDLRIMLMHVAENSRDYQTEYGNVSAASVGAIQRRLLELEQQGAEELFGEPALNLEDFLQTDSKGRGVINILHSDRLMQSPRVYATLLLWMLSELFEMLPEVGDPDKPKLVFFFDEAHLLFDEAPKALLEKIELVVRLIRSKGVGVFFVTQNPTDVPDSVLGQLGNRVQHALRAFTVRDQRAVKAAAETFRINPDLDVEQAITEVGVGEALVSFLDRKGRPGIVQRALILPPKSRLGTLDASERERLIDDSVLGNHYEKEIDRESAYEILIERRKAEAEAAQEAATQREKEKREKKAKPRSNRQSVAEAFIKSAARSIGSSLGRKIMRGVLGNILK